MTDALSDAGSSSSAPPPFEAGGVRLAAWFNGRAKQVTPKVVRAFTQRFPRARCFVTQSLDDAKRCADDIARDAPTLLLCGGGDGTIMRLLNLLREAGATPFPTIGLLRLGTGNGWPNALGAPSYLTSLRRLPKLRWPLVTKRFDLVDVEGTLCHFAGAGWDATILSDYKKSLAEHERQLVAGGLAARLHKGVGGYLYSLFRYTVPEDVTSTRKVGRPRVVVSSLDAGALTLDARRVVTPVPEPTLYDGVFSIAAVGTEPEWGARFRAFPFAGTVPRRLNLRVYDRSAFEAVDSMFKLWRGDTVPGMRDYFVTRARMTFSRPVPFQIAGDPVGEREAVELSVANDVVDLVDWRAQRFLSEG